MTDKKVIMNEETRRRVLSSICAKAATTAIIAEVPAASALKPQIEDAIESEMLDMLNVLDINDRVRSILSYVHSKFDVDE